MMSRASSSAMKPCALALGAIIAAATVAALIEPVSLQAETRPGSSVDWVEGKQAAAAPIVERRGIASSTFASADRRCVLARPNDEASQGRATSA